RRGRFSFSARSGETACGVVSMAKDLLTINPLRQCHGFGTMEPPPGSIFCSRSAALHFYVFGILVEAHAAAPAIEPGEPGMPKRFVLHRSTALGTRTTGREQPIAGGHGRHVTAVRRRSLITKPYTPASNLHGNAQQSPDSPR